MAYQMNLTLSDDEYAALAHEAAQRGVPIESVVHTLIASHTGTLPSAVTSRAFLEQLYREGKVLNLPTRQPLAPEEEAERERLAQKLAGGTPASEMAIEDRGPR